MAEPINQSAADVDYRYPEGDCRLYLPDADGWAAHVMRGSERQYCYSKAPGQDYFHLIVPGEIFVQKGDEKLCLMCAVRDGVLTTNRLFWQSPVRKSIRAADSVPLTPPSGSS